MNDLVTRLKAASLPESMGLRIVRGMDVEIDSDDFAHTVDYNNDDCPGSALFCIRGLMALEKNGNRPAINGVFGNSYGEPWTAHFQVDGKEGEYMPDQPRHYTASAPTITQAIAEALIAAFGNTGGEK